MVGQSLLAVEFVVLTKTRPLKEELQRLGRRLVRCEDWDLATALTVPVPAVLVLAALQQLIEVAFD